MLYKSLVKIKMPFIMLALILGSVLAGPYLSLYTKQIILAISFAIKDIIVLLLPIVIFGLIFISVSKLGEGVFKFVIWLIPMICISNFCSSWVGYLSGTLLSNKLHINPIAENINIILEPAFTLNIPKLFKIEKMIAIAAISAYVLQRFKPDLSNALINLSEIVSNFVLKQIFIPLTPILVCGFILKMQHENVLDVIIADYMYVMLSVLVVQIVYLTFLYFIALDFNYKNVFYALRNMVPTVITGFTTFSSAASLPLLLDSVEKNISDKRVTKFVVPSTVNFHLVGDCIAIPIFAIMVMKTFGFAPVGPAQYLIFSLYVVIAKFGVAAVPGGGMLVIWPLLENIFGFNMQMLAMTHALYVLFDAFITSANLLGNGVFAMFYYKVLLRTGNAIKVING